VYGLENQGASGFQSFKQKDVSSSPGCNHWGFAVYIALELLSVIAYQHERHTERLKKNAKLNMKSNFSFCFPLSFSATL